MDHNTLISEELDKILFNAKNAITITNLKGQILYVNNGFTNLTGYTLEDVYERKPGEFLQGKDTNPNTIDKIRDCIRQKIPVQVKLVNYTKSGSPYWTQLDIQPLYDETGSPTHFISIQNKLQSQNFNLNSQTTMDVQLAMTIRNAYMTDNSTEAETANRILVLDLPKEDLGGAIYFHREIQNKAIVFVGNVGFTGTPGAQLGALYSSYLRELLDKYKTLSPSLIIQKLKEKINNVFHGSEIKFADKLDASLAFIDETQQKITYTTTKQIIYLIGADLNKKLKSAKDSDSDQEYKDQSFDYNGKCMLYLSSSGLEQQHNKEGKAFSTQQLHYLLSGLYDQSIAKQKTEIEEHLSDWMKPDVDQLMDIILIGIKL